MTSLQVLIFDVRGIACALRRSAVRKLLPLPRLWRPPALPRPVAGFFSLSGQAVPVIRLDALFGLDAIRETVEDTLYRHLILVEDPGFSGDGALLVDRVLDVASVSGRRFSPVPENRSLNGCVEAEIEIAGGLFHLLSLERILFAEERQALAELGREAQSRLSEWTVRA